MNSQSSEPTKKIEIQIEDNSNKSGIQNRTNDEVRPYELHDIANLISQAVDTMTSMKNSSTCNGSRSKFGMRYRTTFDENLLFKPLAFQGSK